MKKKVESFEDLEAIQMTNDKKLRRLTMAERVGVLFYGCEKRPQDSWRQGDQ